MELREVGRRKTFGTLTAVTVLALAPVQVQAQGPAEPVNPLDLPGPPDTGVTIYTLFAERAAHVQTVGELFSGKQEAASTGSGLLIGNRLVLTANHVVPDFGGRYKSTRIDIRLGSREAIPTTGTIIGRDEANDLALIQISPVAAPEPFCPVRALTPGQLTPPGSSLYVLGFPLGQQLSIVSGIVSNHTSTKKWQTDAALNAEASGGAAYSSKGYLVGLGLGGITEWEDPDGTKHPVFGINAMIPIGVLAQSPLAAQIAQQTPNSCWRMVNSLAPTTTIESHFKFKWSILGTSDGEQLYQTTWIDKRLTPKTPPEQISRTFSVKEMKDDHPALVPDSRAYPARRFEAEPGYRIEDCAFHSASANNESAVGCTVSPDGRSASFTFTLTSGPIFDRWRGWIYGGVTLRQVRQH